MIKVNFSVCGFFKSLCDFFYSDKKNSPGCQNHKLGIKSKNLGRSLLSQMFLQNIFRFWAEELGNLAENHWQGCQNPIHLVRRNTFTATFSMQVFKDFKFSGLVVKFPWQQRKIIFRVDKCSEKCLDEQIKEKPISKEKKVTNLFLQGIERSFFWLLAKNFRHACQNATYVPFKDFEVKQFLKDCTMFQPFSDFEMKKVGPSAEKVFSVFF